MEELRALKIGLFGLGLLGLISLVVHIGPSQIYHAAASLGPGAIVLMLLPSAVMYVLDCLGWRFTLGPYQTAVPFRHLFMVRMAGEFVNATTPTAGVGGEPLKATLLKRYAMPLSDGLASVIVAKTTMTIAQIIYILLGLGLGVWLLLALGSTPSGPQWVMALVLSLALLLFLTALFVLIQRHGLFSILFKLLHMCRIHLGFLEANRKHLLRVDTAVVGFYTRDRTPFLWSTTAFFCGWLAEAAELYVILRYLGEPIDALTAVSIDALFTLLKGGTSFIPGSVGAQEGGTVMLLASYGYSDVTGITFALLRRLRELFWIIVGVGCLAILMRSDRQPTAAGSR